MHSRPSDAKEIPRNRVSGYAESASSKSDFSRPLRMSADVGRICLDSRIAIRISEGRPAASGWSLGDQVTDRKRSRGSGIPGTSSGSEESRNWIVQTPGFGSGSGRAPSAKQWESAVENSRRPPASTADAAKEDGSGSPSTSRWVGFFSWRETASVGAARASERPSRALNAESGTSAARGRRDDNGASVMEERPRIPVPSRACRDDP